MLIDLRSDSVVIRAPAKVNLYLEILAKRADGYHELQTLMVAVDWYDTIEIKEDDSGDITLLCDHPQLNNHDNLAWKAADLLRRHTGCSRGCTISLTKNIPFQAGLAGGSSDAAATLAGLNELWGLKLQRSELESLSAQLGSDIAFFFSTPAAWCEGRGERVTPLPLTRPLDFVIVCPNFGLSTAEVYRNTIVPARPCQGDEIKEALAAGDIERMGRALHNRLQEPADKLRPELARYRSQMERAGPAGVQMSGSGTALFALCRDREEAERVASAVRTGSTVDPHVCVARSSP